MPAGVDRVFGTALDKRAFPSSPEVCNTSLCHGEVAAVNHALFFSTDTHSTLRALSLALSLSLPYLSRARSRRASAQPRPSFWGGLGCTRGVAPFRANEKELVLLRFTLSFSLACLPAFELSPSRPCVAEGPERLRLALCQSAKSVQAPAVAVQRRHLHFAVTAQFGPQESEEVVCHGV